MTTELLVAEQKAKVPFKDGNSKSKLKKDFDHKMDKLKEGARARKGEVPNKNVHIYTRCMFIHSLLALQE